MPAYTFGSKTDLLRSDDFNKTGPGSHTQDNNTIEHNLTINRKTYSSRSGTLSKTERFHTIKNLYPVPGPGSHENKSCLLLESDKYKSGYKKPK